MSDEDPPNFLNILMYMAAGAFVTYIWLNKSKTQVQSTKTEYLLYNQNNELLEQLKLLNDALNHRDNLLSEYYKTSQQQYQNIPAVIASSMNTELQQIALYLDAVNTQLEQINNQIKQVLEQNYQLTNKNNQHNINDINKKDQNEKNYHTDNKIHKYIDGTQKSKIIKNEKIKNDNPTNDKNTNDNNKNDNNKNDKWSVKRGTDGRIKSLQDI